MRSTFIILGSFFVASLAGAAEVKVTINQVRNNQGMVAVALWRDDGTFMKGEAIQGMREVATSPKVTFTFKNVSPGRYALSAYHDENSNEELDRNLFTAPTEGYGFSRDARGLFSAPSFDQAVVNVGGDTDLVINLGY